MDSVLTHRSKIYDNIRLNCNMETDHDIYLDVKIKDDEFNSLKDIVRKYIIKTLRCFYKNKSFDAVNDYLVRYKDDIINLPNRTPNGAFYPKKENISEYNDVQKIFNKILMKAKLHKQIDSIAPLNFRIVDGARSEIDNRFYATTKLHSDSWNGHFGDAVISIGIHGDESTSVEFNKPIGIADNFFKNIDDFDEGVELYKNHIHIENLKFGYITIFDHSCLHRTIKHGGGLRISIDAGVIIKDSSGCRALGDKERYKYMEMGDILKIGKTEFLEANETLDDCYNKYKNHDYSNKPNSSIFDNLKINKD